MNRAGLHALPFRAATHDSAKRAMLERASTLPQLAGLQVRSESDLSVALIDSWAAIIDVLCFYQERLMNEAFVRTCVEADSLVHLAALVGYEIRPGLAAGTMLAFTCEPAGAMRPDAPVIVDVGMKVQSLPGPGETPQTFETVDVLDGRADWSSIRPHLFERQRITASTSSIVVGSMSSRVRPGDCILIVIDGLPTAKLATDVRVDPVAQTTTIALTDIDRRVLPTVEAPVAASKPATQTSMRDVRVLAHLAGTDAATVARRLTSAQPAQPTVSVFALRARAALFGANAPEWRMLPTTLRAAYGDDREIPEGDWPFLYPVTAAAPALYLDTLHPQVVPESWIVVRWPAGAPTCAFVTNADEAAVAGFSTSTKVTRLQFKTSQAGKSEPTGMADVRAATVYLQSEELSLRETISVRDLKASFVEGNDIELDKLYPDLERDRIVYISGETEPGDHGGEFVTVESATLGTGGRTLIRLRAPLAARYRKATVSMNANVVRATHGESVSEVLGSGDAAVAFQRFPLRQGPLTYLPDENGRGDRAQLTVWVNEVVWRYVPSFAGCGSHDRVYTLRYNAGGDAYVEFGDGVAGARVRTGVENVRATYRRGIGLAGALGPNKLSILLRQPLGVRAATNPQATAGAAAAESTETLRRNLGSAATILHRLVSLSDYETFANAYAGIGKAKAEWLRLRGRRTIVVTIAASDDTSAAHEALLPSLMQTLQSKGDRYVPLSVVWYRRASFRFSSKIKPDPAFREPMVLKEVRLALGDAFGFQQRMLAQEVTLSQILRAIHAVDGVLAASVEGFRRSEESVSVDVLGLGARAFSRRRDTDSRLRASMARIDDDGKPIGAELLTVDPASLSEIAVWS